MSSDLDAAIGTPRETSAKLDHTLRAYGRMEKRLNEVKRERDRYKAALEAITNITEEMIDRAAEAYVFGVMPGDESEATDAEIREMAERVLRAALSATGDA